MANERSLIAVNSYFPADSTLSPDQSRAEIKGFASLQTIDRSGHSVDPYEFRIEKFMVNPTLLYNHQHYVDSRGNRHKLGQVTKMLVAKIVKGDDDNYNIVRDGTRDVVAKMPKEKLADVPVGTKGLWVEAEVTVPEIAQKIHAGELSMFSWRGLTRMEYAVGENSAVYKQLQNINLYEVSVVTIPDNEDAVFVMKHGDSGTEFGKLEGPLLVHSVRFNKNHFENKRAITNCLDRFGFSDEKIIEDDNYCYAVQKSTLTQDANLVSVQLDEVELIVGKMNDVDGNIAVPVDKETSDFLNKGKEMAETSTQATETPSEVTPVEKTSAVDNPVSEATPKVSDVEAAISKLTQMFEEKLLNTTTVLNGVVETNKTLCESIAKHFQKEEAPAETPAEEEKVEDVIKSLQEELKNLKAKYEEISKSVPALTEREETVDIEKKAKDEDPYACLDSVMTPFLSKVKA